VTRPYPAWLRDLAASTKAINQLKAVIVTAGPALRESLTGLGPMTLLGICADLPDPDAGADVVERSVVITLRLRPPGSISRRCRLSRSVGKVATPVEALGRSWALAPASSR
jgi:hypothetical protein